MHLIKATVIKAILAGTAATATVSTGVVLTAAAVEFSTGNYAEASKEIEEENMTSDAETYVSPIIASQEGSDDVDSYIVDTTDRDYGTEDIGTAHDNMAAVENTNISSPAKTADSDKTADSSLAGVTGNTGNGSALAGSTVNTAASTNNSLGSTVDNTANTAVNTSNSSADTAADINNGSVNAAANTGNSSVNVASNTGNGSANTVASVNNSAPANAGNSPVSTAANTENGSDTASSSAASLPDYHHSTSIYGDDGSLLRVEYYVEDQNLPAEYSDVANFDKDTNSYTETVYRYDEENEVEVVVRTDTYVNGELVSSESP